MSAIMSGTLQVFYIQFAYRFTLWFVQAAPKPIAVLALRFSQQGAQVDQILHRIRNILVHKAQLRVVVGCKYLSRNFSIGVSVTTRVDWLATAVVAAVLRYAGVPQFSKDTDMG
jgi:hypothetical protein